MLAVAVAFLLLPALPSSAVQSTCAECHAATFVRKNIENADHMLKEADKLFAEAIEIVAGLRKDGVIPVKEGEELLSAAPLLLRG